MATRRPARPRSARLDRAQGAAFDDLDRTADVRAIDAPAPGQRGRYGIREVPLFLWRTEAVPLERSPLVTRRRIRSASGSTRSAPTPSCSRCRGSRPTSRTSPSRRTCRSRSPDDGPATTPPPSTARPSPARDARSCSSGRRGPLSRCRSRGAKVRFSDLSDVPGGGGTWAHEPAADEIAIDPVLGRVFLGTAARRGRTPARVGRLRHGRSVGAGNTPAGTHARAAAGADRLGRAAGAAAARARHPGWHRADRRLRALRQRPHDRRRDGPDRYRRRRGAARGTPRARPLLTALQLVLAPEPRTRVVLDGLTIAGGPVVLDEVGDNLRRTIEIRDCTLVPGHERTADGEAAPTRSREPHRARSRSRA